MTDVYYWNRDTDFYAGNISSCHFIVNHFLSPQPLQTTSLICSYSFIFSVMFHQWNYAGWSLLSLSIPFWEFLHVTARSPFLFIPHMDIQKRLSICQLIGIWVVSRLGLLRINLLKNVWTSLYMDIWFGNHRVKSLVGNWQINSMEKRQLFKRIRCEVEGTWEGTESLMFSLSI